MVDGTQDVIWDCVEKWGILFRPEVFEVCGGDHVWLTCVFLIIRVGTGKEAQGWPKIKNKMDMVKKRERSRKARK